MVKRILLGLLLTGILTGCATDNGSQTTTYEEAYRVEDTKMAPDMESAANQNIVTGQSNEDVSLIHTGEVSLQTIAYDEDKQNLLDIINKSNGSIQYQDEYQDINQYSSNSTTKQLFNLYLTVRVPQEDFEALLEQLTDGGVGELVGTSRGSEDVTRSVRDFEIRLDSIDARVERLNELLEQAENIADIIEIQNNLDSAILERDQILSEQDYLTDQVARSTINIRLREVMELDDGVTTQLSFWDELVRAISQTGYRAIDVLQQGILSLIFILPYLLFIVILYLIYRWIIKPILKAVGLSNPLSRKKRQAKRVKVEQAEPPVQKSDDELPPSVN